MVIVVLVRSNPSTKQANQFGGTGRQVCSRPCACKAWYLAMLTSLQIDPRRLSVNRTEYEFAFCACICIFTENSGSVSVIW
jgi:hypothetical protein